MHLLIIPTAYPNSINERSGNFIRNQVDALNNHSIIIGVLGVFNISILALISLKRFLQLGCYQEKRDTVQVHAFLYPVIPRMHLINNYIRFIIGKLLLRTYIKKHGKPDLIHLHTFEAGRLAMWASDYYHIPYICTEHSSIFQSHEESRWHKTLARKVFFKSRYNIAVSQEFCDYLQKQFGSNFHYLPNFVNTNLFLLKPKKKARKQFIHVAYLNPVKNQRLLISAFSQAFSQDSEAHLTIIGDGPEESKLKDLIKELKIDNISLYGYLPQEQLLEKYHQSDYFVLSSLHETFGLVLIEAMSCGLPVISTKNGGAESIITQPELGLLCKNDDEEALALTMKKILALDFDSSIIRNYVQKKFSYASLSKQLIAIYNQVLSE